MKLDTYRWPSEEVQSAGKCAWASVCLAICPSGVEIQLFQYIVCREFIQSKMEQHYNEAPVYIC